MIKSAHDLVRKVIEYVDHENLNWTHQNFRKVAEQEGDVSGFHRNQCVQWLIRLNKKFNFQIETLFLAVQLLDKFLLRVKAKVKYLKCVAVTCLYISAKFNEENEDVPTTKHLIDVSECGCSVAEVARMEMCLLQHMDWNVWNITSFDYLTMYHSLLMVELEARGSYRLKEGDDWLADATSLLTACLTNQEMLNFPPSVQGLAVLAYLLKRIKFNFALQLVNQFRKFIKVNGGLWRSCKSQLSRMLPKYVSGCKLQLATHSNMRLSSVSSDSDASDNDDDDFSDYFRNLYQEILPISTNA